MRANAPNGPNIPAQLTVRGQIIAGGGSPQALLTSTSKILAKAETVDDFLDVRKQAKAVSDVFRDLKVRKQLVIEAACQMVRAEHGLGRLLAQLPLAKGSPGNQRTGKVDRSHSTTGPLLLEDLGLSKNASQRVQWIGLIPEERLEQWMIELCEKGKATTLKGALDLANNLYPPNPTTKTAKPGNRKNNQHNSETTDPDYPSAIVQNALEHLKIVAEQMEPLYDDPPTRSLKQAEQEAIRHFLQALADELADLERYHHNYLVHSSSHLPFGGGRTFTGGPFRQLQRASPVLNRADCRFPPTPLICQAREDFEN